MGCFDDENEEDEAEEVDPYFEDDDTSAAAIPSGEYSEFVLNGNYQKSEDEKDELDEERLEVYAKRFSSVKTEFFSKSEWHFKKSVRLNASLVMAYNNYGCLLRRLELHSRAKEMFAKALSIDPKFVMAKRNLVRAEQKEKGIDVYNEERTAADVNYANKNSKNGNINSSNIHARHKAGANDGGCLVM